MVDRRDQPLLVGLIVALLVATAALGGVPRWSQAVVGAVLLMAVATVVASRRRPTEHSPLFVLVAAATSWTAVQLLPLPEGVIAYISPMSAVLQGDGSSLTGVDTTPRLTVDPAATWRSLAFLIVLLGAVFVGSRVASSERGRYAILASVACTCGIASLIGAFHSFVDASHLYGIYRPLHAGAKVSGPLLNPNHMGCLMAVGGIVSTGLIVYPRQSSLRRVGWAVVLVACVAMLAATVSRGALLALALGLVVTLATLLAQRFQTSARESRRTREQFLARTFPVAIMLACGVTLAIYLGADDVISQIENTSLEEAEVPTSKFAAWRSSAELIKESPWVGVGRGAVETAFTRVHPASAFATFSHLENSYIQAVVEWGIPAVLVFVILFVWCLLRALRRWNDGPLGAASLGALAAVGFQSNFDFAVEFIGVAIPVVLIASCITYSPLEQMPSAKLRATRAMRVGMALALALAVVVLVHPMSTTADEDHRSLRASSSRDAIENALRRHPLDYFPYAILAQQQITSGDPAGIALLNHALRLHPTHAGLHRIAARLLLRTARLAQAELEYATSLKYSIDMSSPLAEICRMLPRESAARAIPLTRSVDHVVRALQTLGRSDVALEWLKLVIEHTPTLDAAQTLSVLAMERRDLAAAEIAATARCNLTPSNRCRAALARVLAEAGKHSDVVRTLSDVASWTGRKDEQLAAWLALCDAHISLRAVGDARRCLHRLDASGVAPPQSPVVQKRHDALMKLVTEAALEEGQ